MELAMRQVGICGISCSCKDIVLSYEPSRRVGDAVWKRFSEKMQSQNIRI